MNNKSLERISYRVSFQYNILNSLRLYFDERINIEMIREFLFNEKYINNLCPYSAIQLSWDSCKKIIKIFSINFTGKDWPFTTGALENIEKFHIEWNEEINKYLEKGSNI